MYRKKTWIEKDREKLDLQIQEAKALFRATIEAIRQLPSGLKNAIQDLFDESILDVCRDPYRDSFRLQDHLNKKPYSVLKNDTGRRSEHPLMIAVSDAEPLNLDHAEFAREIIDHIIGQSTRSDDFQTMIDEETNEHILTILTRKFENSQSETDPSGRISAVWRYMIETIMEKSINPLAEIHRTSSRPWLQTEDNELLCLFNKDGRQAYVENNLPKPD
jgi:hypothetical protein